MEGSSESIKDVKGQNIWFDGTLGLITGQTTVEENHFIIYPNPTKDYCNLKYNGADIKTVLIINVQGIVVYKENVNKLSPRINVSRLKKGFIMYKSIQQTMEFIHRNWLRNNKSAKN